MTNKVSIVIIGVNEWDKYTKVLLNDIKEHEPTATIICVDNGSQPAYPGCNIRLEKTVCYAAALNYGISQAIDSDWFILMNNDVRIQKPFIQKILELDSDKLYGFYTWNDVGAEYLSGWCYFLPQKIYKKVGKFDEGFTPMWFEDADYSIRTIKSGFELMELRREEWGFVHLAIDRGVERREYMKKYSESRNRNMAYLKEKHGL